MVGDALSRCIALVGGLHGVIHRVGGLNATLDSGVCALNLHTVQETWEGRHITPNHITDRDTLLTSGASEDGTSREGKLGDGMVASLIEGASTVGHALAALEVCSSEWVVLPALELLVSGGGWKNESITERRRAQLRQKSPDPGSVR